MQRTTSVTKNIQTRTSFIDTCACCGDDFTSTSFSADVAICRECDTTSTHMVNKVVNDTINGAISNMQKVGGHDSTIKSLQSLNQEQKNQVVESWFSR